MACGSQGQAAAERRVPGLGGQEKEGLLQETEAEGKAQSHGDQGLAVAAASQQDKGPPCHLLDGGDSERCWAPLKKILEAPCSHSAISEHGPHQVKVTHQGTSNHIKSISRCFYQISGSQAPRSLDLHLGTSREH